MESWNVYSQNTPSAPSSAWLCPNNAPGSDWLHPQSNNNTERERNENNAALATPTRFIMEYNDVNQNSSGSFYNPYAQEMERLFENSFLKPEDLLNNNLSSWLSTNESVVPVTTVASSIIADPISATTCSNSPTPSLVTDDDQDQLYNKLQERRISTLIDDDQFPITINTMPSTDSIVTKNQENRQIVATSSSSSTRSTSSSPISPKKSHDHIQREQKVNYPMATSSSFYQPVLTTTDKQDLFTRQRLLTDGKDQYLLTKKHGPKQLLLPLTTTKESMDSTMTVAITSPSPSLSTDDDIDQLDQFQKESHQDFQMSTSTNDLPMQQPSPASSEYFSSNSMSPSSNETTPKQKKRRFSQRKIKRPTKANEEELISSTDEPYSEQELTNSATIAGRTSVTVTSAISKDLNETENMVPATASSSSGVSESSAKRGIPDDGHDESPEEKRSRLLERNRIAAAKCRQKKKHAQESLQQQASDLTQKNTTMHSLVNDLREEALKLKNQLLAHSTCNCNVIQEYVRTSGQFAFARAPYSK